MSEQHSSLPPPPERPRPSEDNPHFGVWHRTREALTALPLYFSTETIISGLRATDIFTLNATLGATIEDQVVETLNRMRPVWDPDERYALYGFVRQSQTFPDVLLARRNPDTAAIEDVVFGIELKGWYLLAKEGEPSFRYQVTPAACTDLDLIVVVPWYLSNVITGVPRVLAPYIESAKYAALYRNYHWQFLRETRTTKHIQSPSDVKPYPRKSDPIADRPVSDAGGNFGRFARTGLMDAYLSRINEEPIAGIAAKYWRQFFKLFQEHHDSETISGALERVKERLAAESLDAQLEERVIELFRKLLVERLE